MAIYKLLHEGKDLKGLKNTIKYNSLNKKNQNGDRLIGVVSNVGQCSNINNKMDYELLTSSFCLEVEGNKALSKNSRQKYLYNHSTISFSIDDDEKLGNIKNATELALALCKEEDPNFDKTPYLLYPQVDSGKLHFHIIKTFFDEDGNYYKKGFTKKSMTSAVERFEKKHGLTLTGRNNQKNYSYKIDKNGKNKRVYFPQGNKDHEKIIKNKVIQFESDNYENIKYVVQLENTKKSVDEKLSNNEYSLEKADQQIKDWRIKNRKLIERNEIISNKNKTLIQKVKSSIGNLLLETEVNENKEKIEENKKKIIENSFFIEETKIKIKSLSEEVANTDKDIKTVESTINKDKVNNEINNLNNQNNLKNTVNNLYRNTETTKDFLNKLSDRNIKIVVNYRDNGTGGVSFVKDELAMAGGKINSYLTFGKIKKNDPELFETITKTNELHQKQGVSRKAFKDSKMIYLDFKKFNKYETEDAIHIYSVKKNQKLKNSENIALSVSKDFSKITFNGTRTKETIQMSIKIAVKSKWRVILSNNTDLTVAIMKNLYAENKNNLFYVENKKPNSMSMTDLKEVIKNDLLSENNLIKLYDRKHIKEDENKELIKFVVNHFDKEKGEKIEKYLNDGHSLKSILEENGKLDIEAKLEAERVKNLKLERTKKLESEKQAKKEKLENEKIQKLKESKEREEKYKSQIKKEVYNNTKSSRPPAPGKGGYDPKTPFS